jgi:hypothetical protein
MPYGGVAERGRLRLYTKTLDEAVEKVARDKRSSLLQKFVNYGRKKFYRIGPR